MADNFTRTSRGTLTFVSLLCMSVATHALPYTSSSPVVSITDKTMKTKVLDSPDVWMMEFYAPWCGHCKQLSADWEKAAKGLAGVAHVGAVDCTEEQSLCGRYGVQGYPTIKIFGANKKSPEDYQGARSAKAIVDAAIGKISSTVKRVSDKSADKFFGADGPKALLFTDKSSTPTLWKSISNTFRGKLAFGDVRSSDSSLVEKYGVQSFPTIVVDAGGDAEPVRYDGPVKGDLIRDFLRPFAGDKGSKSSSTSSSASTKSDSSGSSDGGTTVDQNRIDNRYQPKKKPVAELHKESFQDLCGKVTGMCFIVPVGIDEESEERKPSQDDAELLDGLSKQFKGDKLHFSYIDPVKQAEFVDAFELDTSSDVSFVMFKPKNLKYTTFSGSAEEANLFVERVLSGDAKFSKLTEEPELR